MKKLSEIRRLFFSRTTVGQCQHHGFSLYFLFSLMKKEAKKSNLSIFWLKFDKNYHSYPNSLRSNMGTPVAIFIKFFNAKISKVGSAFVAAFNTFAKALVFKKLALLGNILIAFSCFQSLQAQVAINDFPEKLEDQFAVERINYQQMESFQLRGEQKLQEFSDLIALISDATLDKTFRQEAGEMAKQLYGKPNSKLKIFDFEANAVQEVTLRNYLQYLLKNETGVFKLELGSANSDFSKNFDNTEPIWQLNFTQTAIAPTGASQKLSGTMEILLQKVNKQFGQESMEVWEVLLGDTQFLEVIK